MQKVDVEKEWKILDRYANGIKPLYREKTPYNTCPRCGEWKFREVQRNEQVEVGFGIFKDDKFEWRSQGKQCKNCKLKLEVTQ